MDNVFAVQDEIGRAVAQRLKGSFTSVVSPARELTSADAYTLYLAARAKLRDRKLSSLQEALQMAQQVIATDPDYAPGHALYAELLWHLTSGSYGTLPLDKARKLATAHARRAIALAPNLADGHAILGWVSSGDAGVESLSRAVELDPSRGEFRLYLSRVYDRAGENAKGLEQLRIANEIDPLFNPVMWNYAFWLAGSERFDDAERVIRQFEQRGGSRAVAASTRADIADLYRGDVSEGIRLALLARRLDREAPGNERTLAYLFERVGLHREARKRANTLPPYSRLLVTGDTERLLAQARQDGPDILNQGDFPVAAAALAEARDWDSLVRMVDQRQPDAPSLCTLLLPGQMQVNLHIVKALVMKRRADDASRLLHCMKKVTIARSRGPIRTVQFSAANLDLTWAQIHALEGRPERAFPLLQRAVTRGFRTSYGKGLSEYPQFDPYRSSPQYAAIDARLKQLIAKERAEVLRMQPFRAAQ